MALAALLLLAALLPFLGHSASVDVGIINGTEAKPHSRPYMVSIQKWGKHICGGFLVSNQFVMTAAHCWDRVSELTAVLGAHDLENLGDGSIRMEVEAYYRHPDYQDDSSFDYDILLLKLRGSAIKSQTINWIPIPQSEQDIPAKTVCSVAGWGKTGTNKLPSNCLMETRVTIIDSTQCKDSWARYPTPRMLCALYPGGFCQGDSGGPLVRGITAVGIVSFNQRDRCDSPDAPNVYSKISAFLPWIKSKLQNDSLDEQK